MGVHGQEPKEKDMNTAWPKEMVEGGTSVTAVWAKRDPQYPTMAIIGLQVTGDAEPMAAMTRSGTMAQAQEAAGALGLDVEVVFDADRGVARWVASTNCLGEGSTDQVPCASADWRSVLTEEDQ
jgi:hypothetical protein